MRQGWTSRLVACAGLLACWMMLAMPAKAGGNERPVSGVLAAASGPVSVRPMADQAAIPVRLAIGAKLFFGDEIITGDGVRAQILLRDGTTFSVGEGAALVLDEFVYDPASGDGGIGVVIKKGAFRFVSGRIAKKKPQNMKVLAGTTSIAVRGTEVLGTIGGGGGDSVILISGQVDLVSIAGECAAGGSGGGGDMFNISADGALEFKADVSTAPPAFCNRSLLRSGFGVQVAAGGQLSAPGRVEPDQIDAVIDAVTIRSETSQAPSAAEEDAASDAAQDEVAEAVEAEAETAVDASLEEAAGATGAEPVVEAVAEVEQEGLSEFDKVVMRAFGMLEEDAPEQQTDNAVTSGEIIELAASRQQASEDEEKQAAQDEEKQAAQDEEKPAAQDAEKQVTQDDGKVAEQTEERGLTEEEKRAEYRVGQSQSEESDGSGDDGAGDGAGDGGGSSSSPANSTPVLGSISGIAFSDTSSDDSFTNSTGALSASDADTGDTLTYSISGGAASSALSGYDRARTGTYGTLYLNSATGAYAYVPNDSAIEGTKTSVSDSFTLAVSDGTASATQTLTTSVSGADDAPSLAALSGFTFNDTAADDSFSNGTGTASGTERDTADTLVYSISGGSSDNGLSGYDVSRTGTYGTLYLNSASGAYAYVPNDGAIEGLKTSASESFTLAVTDGNTSASQTLTASIGGAEDTPSLATLSGFTFTDSSTNDTFSNATGTASGSDRDTGDTLAYSISGGAADSSLSGYDLARTGTYGKLYLNSSNGNYAYVPDDSAIEGAKASVSEDFTLSVSDGTSNATQTLTASIGGANDTPTLATLSGFSFTDSTGDDTFSNVTGSASGADRDSGETLTYAINGGSSDNGLSGYDTARTGTYGTLYLNSSNGDYAYVPNDSAIEGAKSSVSEDFTLSVSDGSASATQTLTASISGADDAPGLAALTGISFTDTSSDDTFSNATGTASGTERDSADTLVYSITGGSADNGLSGYDVSQTGTYGTLYLNSSNGNYAFVPDDSAIEGAKTSVGEDFIVAVTDGTTSVSQRLTASISGSDDSLSVAALTGITVTDTTADDSFSTTTSSVTATERDTADTLAYAISGGSADTSETGFTHSRTGTYGKLFINSGTGAYKFVPTDSAVEGLTSSVTEDFTLTVTAGSDTETRTLTTTVAGANDTPVLNAISSVSLTDTTASDTFSAASGTLSASDRDSGQTVTFSATNQQTIAGDPNFTHGVQGTYGSLAFNANTGAYEYTPTDILVNALRTSATDSFTLTASDSSLTSSQTLTVNIAGVDDGPSALDMQNLIDAGGQQNVGATGLRLGIVTDPEGDTVTDQTAALNALPAWLSFGNQVLGDGSVQYFWEIGASEAPWRAGTKSMNLRARSSGIDSAATAFSITFACQSDHCNDFLQSTDTTTSPSVDDPTNIGSIRTGIKIGTEEFTVMSQAQRDVLFDTGVTADGTFRVIYSSAETGSGSPAGSWDIDQTVNVDYKSRAIAVSGTVSANNIGYFDGGSDSFTYNNSMTFADTELSVDSVFGKTASTNGNGTYTLQNGNGDTVHVDLHDQIGFMRDANNMNAALINTNITPSSGNPMGYKDDSNQLIQRQWRLLEPQ